ncbi:GIY-YIG nuclease family protein [Flavobacterium sp. N3904]|uniref:GIY-YIG nuclease family protein n=1 Tax=Flavobacterium sp. N3904 TaxID=2986835 RepID=UPI0022251DE0|nr:GIY-YIG nuclease family protein [Flavobacterium sp. N3904]
MNCVYILDSEKLNRFYIGFTSDFDTRLEFHKNGESHKFTANAGDWKLFLKIQCENKNQGLNIEKHIKKMKSKIYIENLVKYPDIVLKLKDKHK